MATTKALPIEDKDPAHWARIKGDKARRYYNIETGEIIPRRQYDQQIGRLAKEGLTNETQAKKNKAENPIAFSAKPRRGKKKGAELKQYEKEIKKNKVELKHKDGYLTKFVVSPINSVTVAEAFQAIAQIPKARSYRRIITMKPKEGGAEITTATPYNNIPKNVDAVLAELEDLDEIMSSYKFGETYNIESITYIVRIRK